MTFVAVERIALRSMQAFLALCVLIGGFLNPDKLGIALIGAFLLPWVATWLYVLGKDIILRSCRRLSGSVEAARAVGSRHVASPRDLPPQSG